MDWILGVKASSKANLAFAIAVSRNVLASAIASFKASFAIFSLIFKMLVIGNILIQKV
jgi:hypothetical protein